MYHKLSPGLNWPPHVSWEPFFSGEGGLNGTETIITSDVSKAWPVAHAGLGAITYMFEVLMGVMGDRRRWRTMPWIVLAFGIVVVPLGVVSIYFIIIQPIVIGVWLMFSRALLGNAPPMADSDHLVGALIITAAVIAMAEVARPLRFINVAFGLWLLAAPWLLAGATPPSARLQACWLAWR